MSDVNIYLDSNAAAGGDGSIDTPWDSFADINWTAIASAVAAGDQVYINRKRGSYWRETLTLGASGAAGRPIIVREYGTGDKSVINGADIITSWSSYGAGQGQTFQATCGSTTANLCIVDGIYARKGASATTLNDGEWFQSSTTLYLRWDAGALDLAGAVVELGQRNCIYNSNRSYITYDGIELRNANTAGINNLNTTDNQTFLNLDFIECYGGINYRGLNGLMRFCRFIRGGASSGQFASTSLTSSSLDMQYCEFRDSYSRNIRTQYGTAFNIDNCNFVGAQAEAIYNSASLTINARNCIFAGAWANSVGVVINSSAGTFNLSYSTIVPSINGSIGAGMTTGVTIGAGVKYASPRFASPAYTGLISWVCDDGDYIYTHQMGNALRLASDDFEGGTLADYNTEGITGARQTYYQAMVAAGDEIAGHGRHGIGDVTVLYAMKVFCSNYGTSSTVTLSISGNTLTTAVDSVTDLTVDLTNASYNTITEVVAYLNGRSGASGVVYGATAQTNGGHAISQCLAEVWGVPIRVASPGTQFSHDATRYWTEEIANAKTDIETAIGGGYTAPTFIYPQGGSTTALTEFLIANNFVGGRTASSTGMSTLLRNLDHWHVYGKGAPAAHGLLLNLRCNGNGNDNSGNSYTFTVVNVSSYPTSYFRIPTDYGKSADMTAGTSYLHRSALAKLNYLNADWSIGMLIRPTRLTGAETYTLFYHGDASGVVNYSRLWYSADGALHFCIVEDSVEVVRLDSAAGLITANATRAVGVRQQLGTITLFANPTASTGADNNVIATTVQDSVATTIFPGAGSASYDGSIYFAASSNGAGGVENNFYGYISDIYMGQDTALLAHGMCETLCSMGQIVAMMHHSDVQYDIIRNYADAVKAYNDSGGNVLVKTFKSAMAYITAQGDVTSDGIRVRWNQADAGNYQLGAGSPAINAATDLSYTMDLAGGTVPNGAAPDIGAYEYHLGDILLAADLAGSGTMFASMSALIQMAASLHGNGYVTVLFDEAESSEIIANLVGRGVISAQLLTEIHLYAALNGSATVTAKVYPEQVLLYLGHGVLLPRERFNQTQPINTIAFPDKQPNEVIKGLFVDFANRLIEGETLTSATVTATGGIEISTIKTAYTKVIFSVSGGTSGQTATITIRATGSLGSVREIDGTMIITER